MRRPALIVALLSSLIVPLVPATTAAAGTAALSWTPCAENPAVECATLAVPVDWDHPRGPRIDLALARTKATDPAARIGSLVFDPGGPGGSGVRDIVEQRPRFSADLARRFDIVGFDPRGVARSHPIICSYELALREPYPIMRSQAEFDARLAYNEQVRQDCRARTGPLFDHVDTGSVVRDLDALRAALGENKLTYYGVSYGTLIGQLYAERYPGRVRALALDSNMDHSLGTAAFLETEAWAAEDSFDEFVSWCDGHPECALHGRDVRSLWSGLLARADRGELHYPDAPDIPLTALALTWEVYGKLYGPDWADVAAYLVSVDSGTAPVRPLAGEDPEVYNNPTQIFCEDYRLPIRDYQDFVRLQRRSAAVAPDMRMSPLAIGMTVSCLGGPEPIPNPQHRLRVHGSPTLLMGNALHDPATGYSWALGTAEQLGRTARLLTYEGWGHGIYGRGACTSGTIDRYLTSLALPAEGARCAASTPPTDRRTLRDTPAFPGPFPGLPGWRLPLA